MSTFRKARVERVISQVVSTLILRGDIKDPRVSSLLSLGEVEVSKDLSFADIKISGYMDDQQLEKGVEGLNSAAGFIQSVLAKEMKTRNTPKLRFQVNTGIRIGFEMAKKLEDLVRHEQPSTGSDSP